MLWVKLLLFLLTLTVWHIHEIQAQFGYQMMPQPVMPQPVMMMPQVQPVAVPMGYPGAAVQQPAVGGYPASARGNSGGMQKAPWSECSKTCGVESVRTRSYTPCDTSRSSCMEREGCMVPECGVTKVFKVGDEIKVPCHPEASKAGYTAQWFTYEKNSWKYVSLEKDRKYMDDKKNLVIVSAEVGDQGTYRCNLQSAGTIVAETIWHFSVKSPLNTKATKGGGAAAALVILIIVLICVCVWRFKKMKGKKETKNKDKSGAEGYDYGDDFNLDEFGY